MDEKKSSFGAPVEPLTQREQAILLHLAEKKSYAEIAAQEMVAVNMVKWYGQQLDAKLGVINRRQALARARALRLLANTSTPLELHPRTQRSWFTLHRGKPPQERGAEPSPSETRGWRGRGKVSTGGVLPTGTVTFLFTDIQGSTPLWERAPEKMAAALQIHNAVLHQAIEANGGAVFKTVGDAFQAAFATAPQALKAAIEGQRALQSAPWNELGPLAVRMGLHTGEAELDPGGDEYAVSHAKNRIGRIHSVASGGQILLSQETADLVARTLPKGVSLKDLGEHRLKGMQWTEHLFQVCAPGLLQDFPPLATTITYPNNLPLQLTSFIGREKEIAAVKELLGRTRLLTLAGVGGAGKTRLAEAVGAQLLGDFEHGVWLAALAPLTDPALIPSSVATLFGLRPEAERTPMDALGDFFRSKRLLLVLDNCEHLIQEAAQFAEAVLLAAPEVKILATSREALGLAGEMVYPVPSLETPDPRHLPPFQSLAAFEAVRLFNARAGAVQPAFKLTEVNAPAVALICQRLDGIPLAIELAAARVKVLSAEQIATRLDDRFRLLTGGSRTAFPRHQTLHALIDWSYGLLSDAERKLFRCLSVFRGGWTLEAAEALCPCGKEAVFDVLEVLAGLVNKSLVAVEMEGGEANRYRMLETIRQYAQEKLLENEEAVEIRDLHLEYFVVFAEAMEKKLHSPAFLEALGALDAEIDNTRTALGWALERTDTTKVAQALRLAVAMVDYWKFKGLGPEGDEWLSTALAMPGEQDGLVILRAEALLKASDAHNPHDANLQEFCRQSVALYRKTDDRAGLALALINYGIMLSGFELGVPHPVDSATSIALIKEGSDLFEAMGDPWGLAWVYYAKSCLFAIQKDYAAQREMLEKGLACFMQAGDILSSERYKFILFYCTLHQRDYEAARKLAEQSVEFFRKVNHKTFLAYNLVFLGQAAHLQDQLGHSETCCQEALALFTDMGMLDPVVWTSRTLGCAVARQGQIKRAKQILSTSQFQGCKLLRGDTLGDPSGDLAFVTWMGIIAESQDQLYLAARFLGAVEAILETFFKPLDIVDQIEYERITGKLLAALDDPTLTAAWAEGRKLTFEQALEEALAFCRKGEHE